MWQEVEWLIQRRETIKDGSATLGEVVHDIQGSDPFMLCMIRGVNQFGQYHKLVGEFGALGLFEPTIHPHTVSTNSLR